MFVDKGAFEKRAGSVRQKLSELQVRRQARSSLLAALEEAEAAAAEGDAQIAAQREHLSGSQKRHAENEVQWRIVVIKGGTMKYRDLTKR